MTVIKVGGSLFDLPDLAERLHAHVDSLDHRAVLLFGGGRLVDELRESFAQGLLTDEASHWHAIERMSAAAHLFLDHWPNLSLVDAFADVEATDSRPIAFDAAKELRRDAGNTLPIGWHVTSDSIAAWVALRLHASALQLIKSVGESDPVDVRQACELGWLDPHFQSMVPSLVAGGCRLQWVNARRTPAQTFRLVSASIDTDA